MELSKKVGDLKKRFGHGMQPKVQPEKKVVSKADKPSKNPAKPAPKVGKPGGQKHTSHKKF